MTGISGTFGTLQYLPVSLPVLQALCLWLSSGWKMGLTVSFILQNKISRVTESHPHAFHINWARECQRWRLLEQVRLVLYSWPNKPADSASVKLTAHFLAWIKNLGKIDFSVAEYVQTFFFVFFSK